MKCLNKGVLLIKDNFYYIASLPSEIPFENIERRYPVFTLSTCSQFRVALICLDCCRQLVSTMGWGKYSSGWTVVWASGPVILSLFQVLSPPNRLPADGCLPLTFAKSNRNFN